MSQEVLLENLDVALTVENTSPNPVLMRGEPNEPAASFEKKGKLLTEFLYRYLFIILTINIFAR